MKKTLGCVTATVALTLAFSVQAQRTFDKDILTETFGFDENTKHSVPLDDIHQGCSDRDCIQSIDNPQFVTAEDADFLTDDDVVLTLSFNGTYRAYPTRIMDHHEIVNDDVDGTPIAITWCPLCGSGVGVRREVGGTVTEFGVAGVLYNSDLVLYDRKTNTIWDQIEAKGIVGPMTGVELDLVPIGVARWSKWRTAHPDTEVLSRDTGLDGDYSTDRYVDYRQHNRIIFPIVNQSDAIHPKTVVFGYLLDDTYVAYTEKLLEAAGGYKHEFNGRSLQASIAEDGSATLMDLDSGETFTPVRLFWFAWYTFHPDTELVQ